jgi:hypothetical protein
MLKKYGPVNPTSRAIPQSVKQLDYGTDKQKIRFDSQEKQEISLFSIAYRFDTGASQVPVRWVMGAASPGAEESGYRANHSFPSIVEVKNAWCYISTLPYVFKAGA